MGPTEERIKVLDDIREPVTMSEVLSFLALANYSSRFMPNFATLAALLRRKLCLSTLDLRKTLSLSR